jgi:hypothetical protein
VADFVRATTFNLSDPQEPLVLPDIFDAETNAIFDRMEQEERERELALAPTTPLPSGAPPPPPSIDSAAGKKHLEEVAAAQQEIIDRVAAREAATPKPPVSPAPSETFKFDFDLSSYNLDPNRCGGIFGSKSCATFSPTPSQQFITGSMPAEKGKGIFATLLELARLQPSEDNILPGVIGEASREILKNIAITIFLAGLGYSVFGWKGALGGALLWVGPNIPAALEAKRVTEKALAA